jgi:hypothetical protein
MHIYFFQTYFAHHFAVIKKFAVTYYFLPGGNFICSAIESGENGVMYDLRKTNWVIYKNK